ncbi:MAG: site-specific DNA-methyltransferase [Candidatus Muirbacterium halophilum]|nr:site-specific DNA-methyltransferase [Candidatus Muirbacterium halophilum]MCK9477336.1 site-specific DNA-methyltransferase [Candidatus Muirbacterium halophilum]
MDKISDSKFAGSKDIVSENIEKLKSIFPEVFNEDKIDFGTLKEVLGNFVGNKDERYKFTWNGKSMARKLAFTPSFGTLRPDKEESVDWDKTQNLYIEGDNLEVLKILQKSYYNKIKMIYIDPPYNTGKDFVYKDDFRDNIKNYLIQTNQVDSEGRKLSTNSESSGRYHTDWLNMMYPRLLLARNLLREDGVIFISIDDNEVHNLRKICDEIFGEDNFIKDLIINTSEGGGQAKHVINGHEYLLVYAKNIMIFDNLKRPKDIRGKKIEIDNEIYWIQEDAIRKEFGKYGNLHYEEILEFRDQEFKDKIDYGLANNEYILIPKDYGMNIIGKLRKVSEDFSKFHSILNIDKISKHLTADGIREMEDIFSVSKGNSPFSNPKPVNLLQKIVLSSTFKGNQNDIILDFFSGSSTTAHATMQLNAEDGGNRKYIMVQLPEPCDENSEAFKAGYKNICEIGKERIRRAGKKILEENKDNENIKDLDTGFKVFKLDSSNIKEWVGDHENLEDNLYDYIDNIKSDRSNEDILFEILLKFGIDLTVPIQTYEFKGKKIFSAGLGALLMCLENDIDIDVVQFICEKIKELKPDVSRVVFKDSSFRDDNVKTNAVQLLNKYEIKDIKSI